MQLHARQIRAARALLNWSQDDLARASNLSITTIRKIELGGVSPRGKTNDQLRGAFEFAGLEFLDSDGVKLRPKGVSIFEGLEGYKAFFDDVYQTITHVGGDVVMSCPGQDNYLSLALRSYPEHLRRMKDIKGLIAVKCLFPGYVGEMPGAEYCEYRCLAKQYVDFASFYVYGDKCGIRTEEQGPVPKMIVIHSASTAAAYRRQFYSVWDKATPLAMALPGEML